MENEVQTETPVSPFWKRIKSWRFILLVVLLIATVLGGTERALDWATTPLRNQNLTFLDDSLRDTAALIIPVGLAKATADVIEGSTISGNAVFAEVTVQAGDIAQPILDYINIGWKLLLASYTYLLSAKFIVNNCNSLGTPILACALLFLIFNLFFPETGTSEKKPLRLVALLGNRILFIAILLMAILPLTVAGTSYLSKKTTQPARVEIQSSFDHIAKTLSMQKVEREKDPTKKIAILKQRISEIEQQSEPLLAEVTSTVCKLTAVKLLNGFAFPIVSLLFLVWLAKGCFREKEE
ncbi:MAG: hypothetical protein J6U40_09825 [Kiritimatiellae bacterium]|nr:hypothetical protein [Kiritimatiellia bacterium]MBP5226751.1 hypothetical protein [Kiritimatiellia bacterium]